MRRKVTSVIKYQLFSNLTPLPLRMFERERGFALEKMSLGRSSRSQEKSRNFFQISRPDVYFGSHEIIQCTVHFEPSSLHDPAAPVRSCHISQDRQWSNNTCSSTSLLPCFKSHHIYYFQLNLLSVIQSIKWLWDERKDFTLGTLNLHSTGKTLS